MLLVTGTSVALWCSRVERTDGSQFEAMGVLDAVAKEKEAVYGDDLYFSCTYDGETCEVIGNQIQMADFVSDHETPFGELLYGYGNTGGDRREGFLLENAIFTNTLGPMLVTNPWLTEKLIVTAAKTAGLAVTETPLDVSLETESFAAKKRFIAEKESRLTNCNVK